MEKDVQVRPKYVGKVVMAFLLATITFILVFMAGYTVSYYKYQSVLQAQESLRYNLLSFEVENELLGNSCQGFDAYRFTEDIEDMGKVIGLLETNLGKTDSKVLEQKKIYSLLEARHFLYIQSYNAKCHMNIPIVLFFYSNKDSYKEDTDTLSYVLSALKNEKSEVMIYSFDFDLDSSLINLLKIQYNVTKPNSLVINGKIPSEPPTNLDSILKLI